MTPDRSLRTRIAGLAEHFGIDGLAIALVAPGRDTLLHFGVESKAGASPVTERSWFSIGSVGKQFTAMTVLALAAEGRIDLDAAIGDHMSDVPAAWQDRTVHSLMTHTSGLAEYLDYTTGETVPTARAEFMRAYRHLAPAFDEAAGWMYSNTNYILLGFLIAQASGLPYAEAVASRLFAPIGTNDIVVGRPEWARTLDTGRPDDPRDPEFADREVAGDGDILMTSTGALEWLRALVGGDGATLLDASSRVRMAAPAPLSTGRLSPYGCGWFVDRLRGEPLLYHGGHFDGWTAMALIAPARGSGVIVMCNIAPGNTRAVRYLAQVALEGWESGTTPLGLPHVDDDEPALARIARSVLLRPPGIDLDIDRLAEELRLVSAHGDPVRVVPNLWSGVEPDGFDLVERYGDDRNRMRRYRLAYPDRIEHALIGFTARERVFWAWPL